MIWMRWEHFFLKEQRNWLSCRVGIGFMEARFCSAKKSKSRTQKRIFSPLLSELWLIVDVMVIYSLYVCRRHGRHCLFNDYFRRHCSLFCFCVVVVVIGSEILLLPPPDAMEEFDFFVWYSSPFFSQLVPTYNL